MTIRAKSASRPPRTTLTIGDEEYTMTAVRSQGAGGQNVNKVATAIQLRFDIAASSLPEPVKQRLLEIGDRRISREGVLTIKAQRHRTQEMNRSDAIARLQEVIDAVAQPAIERIATKPGNGAKRRRLQAKSIRSKLKATRRATDE